MADSNPDDLPYADEPTRDVSVTSETSDGGSFGFNDSTGQDIEVPKAIGDYEIRQLIGAGGMGRVFLAEHTRMARIVAIKILPAERMVNPGAVDRFYGEIRAASRLMHPNIVTAFDAGETAGLHYLVMEYVEGKDLAQLVVERGPLSVGEAANLIRQAARGLLHAHRAGIVHRDVKPANLMRADDGTVKILDLGLAQVGAASLIRSDESIEAQVDSEAKGKLVGTLSYMSPEQLEDSQSVDARSDIYALGATLYFLLTGKPPYQGDFLEQMYGHRHGEIPDLMRARNDIDLRFANLFTRMMAKSKDERYASLDEVIEDLAEYANQTDTPDWTSDYSQIQPSSERSTEGGGSTVRTNSGVFAIDFGMFYAASASASATTQATLLPTGGNDQLLFQSAVASLESGLVFGKHAMEQRDKHPKNLAYCLPLYIGKDYVDREIAGRKCPPEVLMAMALCQIKTNAWQDAADPQATAITVPASYDQLHRQSIMLAAKMAGLKTVRLVDRSTAAVQSQLVDSDGETMDDFAGDLAESGDQNVLFIGLTGQATEVGLFRRDSSRFEQIATEGHWHGGSLPWLQRLVDLAAAIFVNEHGFDPRKTIRHAARLQIACERAMNSMMLMKRVAITIKAKGQDRMVVVGRRQWLHACQHLASANYKTVLKALKTSSIAPSKVDSCILLGPLLRVEAIRKTLLADFSPTLAIHHIDRTDVARGAAACLAAELPGRNTTAMPPRSVTSQTIGIVIKDSKGRRRILPIINKGTLLPARTNRRLTVPKDQDRMTLTVVESSGVDGKDWQSLGKYEFNVQESNQRARMIAFELNINGCLTLRAHSPGTSGSSKLTSLPAPPMSEADVNEWTTWLRKVL